MSEQRNIWSALMKDRLSRFGLAILTICTVIAIGGAYLRPDSTRYANQQFLSLARLQPGEKVEFLVMPNEGAHGNRFLQGLFFGGIPLSESRHPFDSLGISQDALVLYWDGNETERLNISLFEIDRAISVELLEENFVEQQTFLLGTDSFGRDMLSRLMGGSLVSLSVGLISVLISLLIGVTLGAIAGYFRGFMDSIIMWFINVIWSIPTLLMVIAITLVMGKGFVQVFIAVGLTMWVEVARIVRGQFLSIREQAYLEAGRSMGFSDARLIFKHMLPNAMGPVIVISAANFASAILIEAGLSFLGIGTQIPMPSWGGIIKEHYAYITTDMAYLAILPGICITLLVLSFMLIGNRLRDVLDVKSN